MNKNVPNITNTDDVLTGITCLKAFECIAQSPVTHVQLGFGLCGSLTQKPGTGFYKARDWLEQGVCGDKPLSLELQVAFGDPGAAQVSSKRRESKADPSAQSIPLFINLKLQENSHFRAALKLRARFCFSVCTF